MTKTFKKYIWILLVLVVIGGIIILGRQKTEKAKMPSGANKNEIISFQSNLTPEESISHGHGLAVDVKDSNKLYIATHYGLFVLINEKNLYRIGKSRDDYMGFVVHPTEPNVFFTSGHPAKGGNLGVQRSDDD